MKYIGNFEKSRNLVIGSSDFPALIKHPLKPESLAGYGRTALTVYQEKLGIIKREPAGIYARLGHELECFILSETLREIGVSDKTIELFRRGYMLTEINKTPDGYKDASSFQNTKYLHHTEAKTSDSVSHADLICVDDEENQFIIEAKVNAISFGFKRRENNPYEGYDVELKGGQGIPLKHFYQVQHQIAVYNLCYGLKIKYAILSAYSDGKIQTWKIKSDVSLQEKILEICSKMKRCMDTKTPPKDMAMNTDDIKALYPEIKEDFAVVSGDELESVIKYRDAYKEAKSQESAWKDKKEDAASAISIILKDRKAVKGIVDGELTTFARWTERKGSERVMSLKEIQKNNENAYKYLVKNNLINKSDDSKYITVL